MKQKFFALSRAHKIAIIAASFAVLGAILSVVFVLLPTYSVVNVSDDQSVAASKKLKTLERRSQLLTGLIVGSAVVSFSASIAGGSRHAGRKSQKKS